MGVTAPLREGARGTDHVNGVALAPGSARDGRIVALGVIGGWVVVLLLGVVGIVARERVPKTALSANDGPRTVCLEAPGASAVPRSLLIVHGRGLYCGW